MRDHILEQRSEPVISRAKFVKRIGAPLLFLFVVIEYSVLAGMFGYRLIAGYEWDDAFFQACLALGGHAVEHHPSTTSGRAFAGLYFIYAHLVVFSAVGALFVPIGHRVFHTLHQERKKKRRIRGGG